MLNLPGIRRKATTPTLALRAFAGGLFHSTYSNHLCMHTVWSFNWAKQSSTFAYHLPQPQDTMLSSATIELSAVNEAPKCIVSQDTGKVFILTDSRVALQRLTRTGSCLAPDASRSPVLDTKRKGFRIAFQRDFSHAGLLGNKKVNRLASKVHRLSPSLQTPGGLRCHCRAVRQHFVTPAPHGQYRRHLCHAKGLKRMWQLCSFEFGQTVLTQDLLFTVCDEVRQQPTRFAGITKTSHTFTESVLASTAQGRRFVLSDRTLSPSLRRCGHYSPIRHSPVPQPHSVSFSAFLSAYRSIQSFVTPGPVAFFDDPHDRYPFDSLPPLFLSGTFFAFLLSFSLSHFFSFQMTEQHIFVCVKLTLSSHLSLSPLLTHSLMLRPEPCWPCLTMAAQQRHQGGGPANRYLLTRHLRLTAGFAGRWRQSRARGRLTISPHLESKWEKFEDGCSGNSP